MEALARYRLRSTRGNSLLNMVQGVVMAMFYAGGMIFFLKELTGIEIPPKLIPPAVIFIHITNYFIGWLDFKVGFWKIEADMTDREINTYQQEMMAKIDKINDKLNSNHS